MKKIVKTICAFFLAVCLVGCGPEDKVKSTVDSFFQALEKGDVTTAETYVTSDAKDAVDAISEPASDLLAGSGLENNEEIQAKASDLVKAIIQAVFKGHEITSVVKVNDTRYTVTVNVTGLNVNSFETDLNNLLSSMDYSDLLIRNYDNIEKVYNEKGEQEAENYFAGILFDAVNTQIQDYISTSDSTAWETVATVEKEDKDWKITKIESSSN